MLQAGFLCIVLIIKEKKYVQAEAKKKREMSERTVGEPVPGNGPKARG
jgi:hypothetical protein